VFRYIQNKTLYTDDDISPELSRKLYSALRASYSGNAEKLMMTKQNTWGKGLLYLETIKASYRWCEIHYNAATTHRPRHCHYR